jgi:hypothetical protein
MEEYSELSFGLQQFRKKLIDREKNIKRKKWGRAISDQLSAQLLLPKAISLSYHACMAYQPFPPPPVTLLSLSEKLG